MNERKTGFLNSSSEKTLISRSPSKQTSRSGKLSLTWSYTVHGSRFTTTVEFGGWARGTENLSIEPVPNDRAIVGYVNRATDVFWMMHRTLPFLQLTESAFGTSWAEKWSVLDVSFRQMEEELNNVGIEIARAIEALIDRQFPFGPSTVYVERDVPPSTAERNSPI